nr:helix-turn-helix domain-containing protein [Rhodopirellula sp. JC737]
MSRPDRHDEIEVNFVDRGTLTYLIGGRRVTVDAQNVSVFWAAVPHQIVQFNEVSHYYVVTIPFGMFLQWGLPENFQSQLITGNVISHHCEQFDADLDQSLFAQWHRDLKDGSTDSQDIVRLELKARLMRLAHSHRRNPSVYGDQPTCDEPKNAVQHSPNLKKAELMACYIARHYKSRLLIKDIADSVDLHPDYAATLFRKTFGTTLNSLITRHRVAEAQRLLITSNEQIVHIAWESGFESLSRFNRAFKEVTGTTPSRFRNECRTKSF